MISTVASGNVEQYVGPSDILMLHSVADVQGLNSITRAVLVEWRPRAGRDGSRAGHGRPRCRRSPPSA